MPWNAVGYFTMWLQTLGFSDMPAGALTALFWGGTALGNLLGGIVGDALAKRLPNVGRQLTCQVSIQKASHLSMCRLYSTMLRAEVPQHGSTAAPCLTATLVQRELLSKALLHAYSIRHKSPLGPTFHTSSTPERVTDSCLPRSGADEHSIWAATGSDPDQGAARQGRRRGFYGPSYGRLRRAAVCSGVRHQLATDAEQRHVLRGAPASPSILS